jgi:hypothetical protein
VTNAYPPPANPDWQQWQTPVAPGWPTQVVSPVAPDPVRWIHEAVVAGFVVAYSVVIGAVVGLVWPHFAPRVRLAAAINGSEAASKALLSDDMRLGLLGLIASVVAVAVLALVARDAGSGPGGVVGLAVGGVLGSLVAAQIGHLVQGPHLETLLRTTYPGITKGSVNQLLGYFGFRLRTKAVLLAWPLAAVILQLGVLALRGRQASAAPPSVRA